MKSTVIVCLALLSTGQCLAEAETPSPFLGENQESQKVQEFYKSRCDALAKNDASITTDALRQNYMTGCIKDMAKVWPVGYDESE